MAMHISAHKNTKNPPEQIINPIPLQHFKKPLIKAIEEYQQDKIRTKVYVVTEPVTFEILGVYWNKATADKAFRNKYALTSVEEFEVFE
jgi:actin-like ATPase involved in cell morphogenesis